MGFIDLHTHTFFSDGVLIPSELVYRAKVAGYEAIAITDHGDYSTFDITIPRMVAVARQLTTAYGLRVVPGIELTYVPPRHLRDAVRRARRLGARLVLVHGETPAETVPPGTNRAALEAGADILAHPGFITDDDVRLAVRTGTALEITTRHGHKAGNPHVARMARRYGARLVLNTDSHVPENLLAAATVSATLRQSGLKRTDYVRMMQCAWELIR